MFLTMAPVSTRHSEGGGYDLLGALFAFLLSQEVTFGHLFMDQLPWNGDTRCCAES